MKKKRVDYFDVAKGIAMICIIAGHMGISTVNSFVFTFHVPIFFLISGYFQNDKLSLRDEIKNKAKSLMIPYFVTCIFIIGGIAIRDYVWTGDYHTIIRNIRVWVIASLYGSGSIVEHQPSFVSQSIGAIWFLPALFFALIIVKYLSKFRYGFWGILIVAYFGYKMTDMIWLPMSIQAGMFASLFVYFGKMAKKENVFEIKCPTGILSGLVGIWLFSICYGGQLYLVRNYAGNGILDIVGALAASYLVILFSKYISENTSLISNILKFYGRNTLIMLCLHIFELKVISWQWLRGIVDRFGSEFISNSAVLVAKLLFCTIGIVSLCWCKRLYKSLLKDKWKLVKNSRFKASKVSVLGREKYWDIAKGIAIITCVLGHCDIPATIRMIIFSFHMPLFFIANGYFIKSYDIKYTFKRSVKTLLCPYVVTCLLSAVIYTFMENIGQNYLELFSNKILVMLGGMSKTSTRFHSLGSVWLVWFVCCLFVTRNIYVILMRLMKNCSSTIRLCVIFIIAIGGYLIGRYYAFLPWSLDVAMVSLIFFVIAEWLRKTDFFNKNYFYTLIVPAAIWIYFLKMGIHIELARRSYPLGLLSILEATAGSIVIISISRLLERSGMISDFFAWCGKNSMIILILHCLEMMYFNWETLIFNSLPFSMNWFRIFLIKMFTIVCITFMYNYLKQLLQKKFYDKKSIAI